MLLWDPNSWISLVYTTTENYTVSRLDVTCLSQNAVSQDFAIIIVINGNQMHQK